MESRIGICVRCGYVSMNQLENYCPNCGIELVNKCPACQATIEHPLACFCPVCGRQYVMAESDRG